MRVISVTNQKGGCGKTTTAINLAASLFNNRKKVLLIDLDPQAHATLGLNVKSDLNIYNVLSKNAARRAKLADIIQDVSNSFDIAPSNIILSTLEQELAGEIGRESRLWETINEFKGTYDYIIIDCPPNLGILTVNAIRASQEIIVPVEASRFSFEGLSQLISIVELIKDRLNHNVVYKILVTNFDSRLRHSFRMLEKIRSDYKTRLFDTIIHVNVKLKEAQNEGQHIFDYDKYSRGAKDYYTLSREIVSDYHGKPESVKPAVAIKETKLQAEMKKVIKEELPRFTEVVFSFKAPDAKDVFVAGDFNDWQTSDKTRMRSENGNWTLKVKVLPGQQYRYRFVVDGNWLEDPVNSVKEMNPYGQMDSILKVGKW